MRKVKLTDGRAIGVEDTTTHWDRKHHKMRATQWGDCYYERWCELEAERMGAGRKNRYEVVERVGTHEIAIRAKGRLGLAKKTHRRGGLKHA